jgi:hypothetical protein
MGFFDHVIVFRLPNIRSAKTRMDIFADQQ